ncbi:GNAT family acetyltransferase [bacterium]|nr:GNAT family acetyltransferase [bacterium]
MNANILIRQFDAGNDTPSVTALWRAVLGYGAPHNEPAFVIEKKLEVHDGLFFVAECDGAVVGTVMAGYDGHRGWIYSLAVKSDVRGKGIGLRLVRHAEAALARAGCVKVNLQVVETNKGVVEFYRKAGYAVEPRISMGKLLKNERGQARSY